jgi:hypothetical protein
MVSFTIGWLMATWRRTGLKSGAKNGNVAG